MLLNVPFSYVFERRLKSLGPSQPVLGWGYSLQRYTAPTFLSSDFKKENGNGTLVPVKARTTTFPNNYFSEAFLGLEATARCHRLGISLAAISSQTLPVQGSLGELRQFNQRASVSPEWIHLANIIPGY